MIKKVFSFSGRISRTEYMLSFILVDVVLYLLTELVDILILGVPFVMQFLPSSMEDLVFIILVRLPGLSCLGIVVWFWVCQAVKRSHDVGRSGWFILLPIYNPFWLCFVEGEWVNRYGEKD